jgi:phage terminase Nu1 subunit (DNA packaging protein)
LAAALRESGEGELNPAAEKARLDKARADLAELDLATKQGQLVPAEMVETAWSRMRDEMRKSLLAVPGKVAPRVHSKMTAAEIEALIREFIDEALQALSAGTIEAEAAEQSGPAQDSEEISQRA